MRELVEAEAQLLQLDNGSRHSEGPVYIAADDSVVWSDVSGDRLLKWKAGQVSLVRSPACFQNGNALDHAGRLVGCSHGKRAIVRQPTALTSPTEQTSQPDAAWPILVDRYQGKRLNSPNDIVVKSDGTLWFTDPPFGLTQAEEGCGGEQEQPGSFVFRFDPATGEIDAVITDMIRPNGLAFSPDEQLLYVSDTSAFEDASLYHHIRVYEVAGGRRAVNGRVFAVISPGQPDGLAVDCRGNLFTTSADSIQIYSQKGERLGKILVPEICANVTFGGKSGDRLLIAAGNSLYAIDVKTQSALFA